MTLPNASADPIAAAPPERRRGPWATWAPVALLLAALSAAVLHPLSTSPATRIHDPRITGSGDAGRADVRLHAWVLASGTRALLGEREGDFFDANIFYPNPGTLAYSEHLLGVQPLYAPILISTRRVALSLNLWILSTFLLSGLAAWWVTWRWFGSHWAGALAAVVFAFAPWRIYTLVHVKLLSVQYFPLIAWSAVEARERPRRGVWLLLAGSCFLEAASCFYLGYLGFLFAGVTIAATAAFAGPGRARYLAFCGSALAAAALAMLPLSLPYLQTVRPGGLFSEAVVSSKTPADYLFPPFPGAPDADWGLFAIVPLLALVGAARGLASARSRSLTAGWISVAIVGLWLAQGPDARLLGLPIGAVHDLLGAWVPGWSSFRVWPRFAILTWFAMSWLAVLPFVALGARAELPRGVRHALAAAIAAGLAVSAWRVPIGSEPEPFQVASIQPYLWLREHGSGDPVVHVPREHGRTDAEYMYLSTLDVSPMLNGYGAYVPPSLDVVDPLVRALPARPALDAVESLALARWLVVHSDRLSDEALRAWDEALGPQLRAGGPDYLIYELPFAGPSKKLLEEDPERSLLGTSRGALDDDDLAAQVRAAYDRLSALPADPLWISLYVRNRSRAVWPALALDVRGLVGVALELRDAAGEVVLPGAFQRLPYDVAPGADARIRVRLLAPVAPGRYALVPCVVQAGHPARRCDEKGAISLEVRGSRPGAGAGPSAPNVLLFTLDTLRADHVGAYGYALPTTPEIDRLAREGLVFETAYAPMGTTGPSHASLFTARHPLAHGVVRNGLALLEEEETLAERLRDAGYRTAAFVSSFPVSRSFGFEQGFDVFDDDFGGAGEAKLSFRHWGGADVEGRFDRRAEETASSLLAWLGDAPRDAPWFVWVHLFDPHGPYRPPPELAALFLTADGGAGDDDGPAARRARYDGEIRYADAQVGRIVGAFDRAFGADRVLVAVTSDHGEGLFDHGFWAHDRSVYEEEVRVPLVLRWPGTLAPGRRSEPAHLVDVAPTLLSLVGLDPRAPDGVDLTRAPPPPARPLFLMKPQRASSHAEPPSGLAVRRGAWKLIRPGQPGGESELYDLAADPAERENLAEQQPDRVRALGALLEDWQAAQLVLRSERAPRALSEQERAGLRALGYVDDSE